MDEFMMVSGVLMGREICWTQKKHVILKIKSGAIIQKR